MMRTSALRYYAALTFLVCVIAGCVPSGDEHIDEKNDADYLRGRALVGSQDFKGAIDEFEKSLEVNPRSAAAHFELAWLCEEKTKDYAAAIYHYQKHLALQPGSEYADKAKDRIQVCKRELAKAEFAPPSTLSLQREIDRLSGENLILRQQADSLHKKLDAALAAEQAAQIQVAQAQAAAQAAQARQIADDNPRATQTSEVIPGPDPIPRPAGAQRMFSNSASLLSNPVVLNRGRTHIVKSGETMASIAVQHGVKQRALLSANPKADPRHLKVGQTLVIP